MSRSTQSTTIKPKFQYQRVTANIGTDTETEERSQCSDIARMDGVTRAVVHKKAVSEIDFTLHVMEDGTQVSTQERVCKGMTYHQDLSFES